MPNHTSSRSDETLEFVRGANYVPTRRMNTYQVWRQFDPDLIDTQMGFASRLHLNALRMWLSPERWWEQPAEVEERLDSLLSIADRHGIRILLCLFKNCGPVHPSPEVLLDDSPVSGYEFHSPSREILGDPAQWGLCRDYIDWFMSRYRSDRRLLAIEIMNEPGLYDKEKEFAFAEAMLGRAATQKGDLRLTIGNFTLENNLRFLDHGLEILQAHPNFMSSEDAFWRFDEQCREMEAKTGLPCWSTEWQRIRKGTLGWEGIFPAGNEWQPHHASLAPLYHRARRGSFFWSLMLRPSYLKIHESQRWLNGVFHEDGAVYSLEDARAIANDPSLELEERREWPAWAAETGRRLDLFLHERDGVETT